LGSGHTLPFYCQHNSTMAQTFLKLSIPYTYCYNNMYFHQLTHKMHRKLHKSPDLFWRAKHTICRGTNVKEMPTVMVVWCPPAVKLHWHSPDKSAHLTLRSAIPPPPPPKPPTTWCRVKTTTLIPQGEFMMCSYFLYVLLCSPVTWLHNMACHLQVTMDNHCFIGSICVDSNSTSMEDRFWCMAFLPAEFYITFKLARVWSLKQESLVSSDTLL
jgi:hypothetical protein